MADTEQEIQELKAKLAALEAGKPSDHKQKAPRELRRGATAASSWKNAANNEDTELELPSGNVCLVKRPGLVKLMHAGVLPNILMEMAQKAIDQPESGKTQKEIELDGQIEMSKILSDPSGLPKIFEAADRITAFCVIEPPCEWHMREKKAGQADMIQESYKPVYEEIPKEDRLDGVLYTDVVNEDDKFYIMNFVMGGAQDLKPFRS